MTLSNAELGQLVHSMWKDARTEWSRLGTLQKRIEGALVRTWMPDNADGEYRDLFRKAASPWLLFARDAIAQGCRIDGYSDQTVWRDAWQANGMDGRQGALNREAIGLGYSFLASLPIEGRDGVAMRPMSALKTFAVWDDPWDERPQYVLHMIAGKLGQPSSQKWMLVDEESVYRFEGDPKTPLNVRRLDHDLGWNPVARIANTFPMGERPSSSVEPAVPVYQRIVDATFTLQMVQRYGAFPQKWMAGGEIAVDAEGKPTVRSSVDGLLHASGPSGETARFGSFQAANIADVAKGLDKHIQDFSALVQVPPHYLLGAIVNMSAEGIAAAESGYFRNIHDRQDALGEGYEVAMRNAAGILGSTAAGDLSSAVSWADESARSIGQAADAILKLASPDVNAPLELLFGLIPGWDKAAALEGASAAYARQQLAAGIQAQLGGTPPGR